MALAPDTVLSADSRVLWERESAIRSCSDPADTGSVSVLVAGDLCVRTGAPLPGPDQAVPWEPLVPELRSHDFALANLECPLTLRAHPIKKSGPAMWGDPAIAAMLARGAFTGVTLANNHILDAGADGVLDTIAACRAAGLAVVGAGVDQSAAETPLILEANGRRLGIIACAEREFSIAGLQSPGAAALDPWRTPAIVRGLAPQVDAVIVILHGGSEHAESPRPGLVTACRSLVDAGADAVVCHHSHVAGPVEVYGHAPIFYGLGNFLFPDTSEMAQGWRRGYAVGLRVTARGVQDFRLLPHEQPEVGVGVLWPGREKELAFAARLRHGAQILAEPELLESAWVAHCCRERRHYLYMALGLTRPERRLLRTGVWPRWRRRRTRVPELLNLLTCDSHREALETILRREEAP